MTRERVVIDANVLISGLFSTTSTPAKAVEKAATKAQQLVEIVEVLQAIRASRDPKDDKFRAAAVNSRGVVARDLRLFERESANQRRRSASSATLNA